MDRRKVALLIALSVLLIFLAIGTAVTAWDVLGGRYEVAGDGVSLVMLLAFLTYADAELVLLLRAKFEDDLKNSEARKVVLVYLIMFLLLVLIGILYFGSAQDKESESLGDEHAISSIPPEVEEGALLPQIIISGEEEEDLHTALFRSGAYVVQMEITTGLTTEYLDPLCNYPVKLFADGREETIEDEEDLKKIGLDTLYSDGLVAAVGDFDVESMKIEGGRAVMGDDLYYVVLEMDEYENVGITEFHS